MSPTIIKNLIMQDNVRCIQKVHSGTQKKNSSSV